MSLLTGIETKVGKAGRYIKSNVLLQCESLECPRLSIVGPPGIGKSYIMRGICMEMGWGLKVRYISNMSLEQVSGIPCVVNSGEEAKFTKSELFNFTNLDYTPPGYEYGKTITVLFIDDFHLCDRIMQKYLFQLLSYKSLNEYALASNTAIILAGNRNTDKACGNNINSAVMNRFMTLEVCSDNHDWLDNFAYQNNVRADITSFIHSEVGGQYLNTAPVENSPWASPRAWTGFSRQLDLFERENGSPSLEDLRVLSNGFLGPEVAAKWLEYREIVAKWDITKMAGMDDAEISEMLEKSFNENGISAWGMISAVMSWLLDSGMKMGFNMGNRKLVQAVDTAYRILTLAIITPSNGVSIRPLIIGGMSFLSDYKKSIRSSTESRRFMSFLMGFMSGIKRRERQDWILYATFAKIFSISLSDADKAEIENAEKGLGNCQKPVKAGKRGV